VRRLAGTYARWAALAAGLTIAISCLSPNWTQAVRRSVRSASLDGTLMTPQFWGVEYGFIGKHLADGRGFAGPYLDVLEPTAVMPPLLPLLFAGVFLLAGYHSASGFITLGVVRALVIAGGCVALERIAADLGARDRGRRALCLATALAFVLAFAPRRLFYILYDEWFMWGAMSLGVLIGLGLARTAPEHDRRRALGWGAFLGAMLLTQPIAGFAFGSATVALALFRRRPLLLGSLVVAFAVMLPWLARNWLQLGSPSPVKSTVFFELYYGTLVEPDGIHREEEVIASGKHPFQGGPEQARAMAMGERAYFAEKRDLFLHTLVERPGLYLAKVGYRLAYATVLFPSSQAEQLYFNPEIPAALKYALYPLPFVAFLVCCFWPGPWSAPRVFVAACYAAFLLPYVLINFWLRYWVQALPVHIVIVWLAAATVGRWWRGRREAAPSA
jgi:hypothetical protein